MAAYRLTPGNTEMAMRIAEHARHADVVELAALGETPLSCLLRGLRNSPEAYTGWIDDEPVCMFGVAAVSVLTGYGAPWMVGTDAIDRHAIPFAKGSKDVIDGMFSHWDRLFNYVDARNARAIRWLRFLGFHIGEPIPHGKNGEMFHPFELRW